MFNPYPSAISRRVIHSGVVSIYTFTVACERLVQPSNHTPTWALADAEIEIRLFCNHKSGRKTDKNRLNQPSIDSITCRFARRPWTVQKLSVHWRRLDGVFVSQTVERCELINSQLRSWPFWRLFTQESYDPLVSCVDSERGAKKRNFLIVVYGLESSDLIHN